MPFVAIIFLNCKKHRHQQYERRTIKTVGGLQWWQVSFLSDIALANKVLVVFVTIFEIMCV